MKYADRHWLSADGLKLHYRDYPGRADRPALLCLPGLTRNARDFADLAERLAGEWRVIAVDLRGRGDSDYAKDSATYNPLQYVEDVAALVDQAGLERVVAVGTSLGGIITMLLAATRPALLAGAVLNDIGPEIEPAGLARIRDYVGQGGSFPTWMHAARALQASGAAAHPGFAISDWLDHAKRLMCVSGNGRIVFDYDMKIAEPILAADPDAPAADLWPAFAALAGGPVPIPVLALRGQLSDLLSPATHARMARELPGCAAVEVPGVGHVPTLAEPAAVAAIDRLLGQIG